MLSAASRLLLLRQARASSSSSNGAAAAAAALATTCCSDALFSRLLRLSPIEIASRMSTKASHDAASPSSSPHLRFHVNPGATLSVETPGPETTVAVTVGELHDAIEASWEMVADSSSSTSTSSSSTTPPARHPPPVEARQVDDRVSLVAHAGSGVRSLNIRIPSRYCSLRATTNGGDLSVEAVREAALEVSTLPGGKFELGTARATVAEIRSGSVSATELVADLLFVSTTEGEGEGGSGKKRSQSSSLPSSSGGNVSVERLVARRGSVSSGGGSLTVRSAFFGESLDLDSGGGELRLGGLTPRATEDAENSSFGASSSAVISSSPPVARLRSRGGPLSVDALEGDADADSGGGELSLHLLRGARGLGVRARSGGAAVRAAVAPELLESSAVVAGDGVVLLRSGSINSSGRTKDVSSAAAEADAALDARWRNKGKNEPPSSSSPFAPLTPASAAAASTAGRRGGGDRVRDHGPAPATLVLIDARPGGLVSVEEESWADSIERKARAAMEARKKEQRK